MAALLWCMGRREAEEGTPWLWWPMSSTHPGPAVSGHVPCWKAHWSFLHACVKSINLIKNSLSTAWANLKMVGFFAWISSGDWQPGFRVAQLFNMHASHSSDRTPSYSFGIDYIYPGGQWTAKHLLYILQVNFSHRQEDKCTQLESWPSLYIVPGKAQGLCLKLCSSSTVHFPSQADHIHCCNSQQLIGPTAEIYCFK